MLSATDLTDIPKDKIAVVRDDRLHGRTAPSFCSSEAASFDHIALETHPLRPVKQCGPPGIGEYCQGIGIVRKRGRDFIRIHLCYAVTANPEVLRALMSGIAGIQADNGNSIAAVVADEDPPHGAVSNTVFQGRAIACDVFDEVVKLTKRDF